MARNALLERVARDACEAGVDARRGSRAACALPRWPFVRCEDVLDRAGVEHLQHLGLVERPLDRAAREHGREVEQRARDARAADAVDDPRCRAPAASCSYARRCRWRPRPARRGAITSIRGSIAAPQLALGRGGSMRERRHRRRRRAPQPCTGRRASGARGRPRRRRRARGAGGRRQRGCAPRWRSSPTSSSCQQRDDPVLRDRELRDQPLQRGVWQNVRMMTF